MAVMPQINTKMANVNHEHRHVFCCLFLFFFFFHSIIIINGIYISVNWKICDLIDFVILMV
jgi:hypothetical protein